VGVTKRKEGPLNTRIKSRKEEHLPYSTFAQATISTVAVVLELI